MEHPIRAIWITMLVLFCGAMMAPRILQEIHGGDSVEVQEDSADEDPEDASSEKPADVNAEQGDDDIWKTEDGDEEDWDEEDLAADEDWFDRSEEGEQSDDETTENTMTPSAPATSKQGEKRAVKPAPKQAVKKKHHRKKKASPSPHDSASKRKWIEQQIEGKGKAIAAVEKRIETRTVRIRMHEACRDIHSEHYVGAEIFHDKRRMKVVIGGGARCDGHIHKIRERDPVSGRPMTVSHGCPWRTGGKFQDGIHQAISKLERDNEGDYERISKWKRHIEDLTKRLQAL